MPAVERPVAGVTASAGPTVRDVQGDHRAVEDGDVHHLARGGDAVYASPDVEAPPLRPVVGVEGEQAPAAVGVDQFHDHVDRPVGDEGARQSALDPHGPALLESVRPRRRRVGVPEVVEPVGPLGR